MIFNFFRNRKKTSRFSEPDRKVWEYSSDYWYYNKTNITKSSNIIKVSIYNVGTDDERKQWTEFFRDSDIEKSKKYRHYDHRIMLGKIDCKKRLIKIEEVTDYDDNGEILQYKKIPDIIGWEDIEPNSIMGLLYNNICLTPIKR